MARKRVKHELHMLQEGKSLGNKPMNGLEQGVSVNLVDEEFMKFHVVVHGPDGTVYEGGEWHYEFELNEDYPFKPPCKIGTVKALTKLYHPDVRNLANGWPHSLSCLTCDYCTWSPAYTIAEHFGHLRMKMIAPDLNKLDCCDDIVNQSIKVSKEEFERIAREWTQKYAIPDHDELFVLKDK